MRMAGLLNNISLLYQELGDYGTAGRYLKRALVICEQNQAGFETAVTYANLANTCVLAESYGKAAEYAETAIRLFERRNLYDAHYCAALSALGMCHYEFGRYDEAEKLFSRGMELVEGSLGRNRQYERLLENRDMCRRAMAQAGNAGAARSAGAAETAGKAGAAETAEAAGKTGKVEAVEVAGMAGRTETVEATGEEREAMTGAELKPMENRRWSRSLPSGFPR